LLERIRQEHQNLYQNFLAGDTRRLYEHAIDACYLQGNMTDAFIFLKEQGSTAKRSAQRAILVR